MLNLTLPVIVCFAAALVYIWATNRDKFKPIDTNLAKTRRLIKSLSAAGIDMEIIPE